MKRIIYLLILGVSVSLNLYFIFYSHISQTLLPLSSLIEPENNLGVMPKAPVYIKSSEQHTSRESYQQLQIKNIPLQQIKVFITQFDYDEAILGSNRLDRNDMNTVKAFWLAHTKALFEDKKIDLAIESCLVYLDFVLDDFQFHQLYIDILTSKHQINEAIEHAYSVQYYLYDLAIKDKSILVARELVSSEINRLLTAELWIEMNNFCYDVLRFDPNNMHLYWCLAQANYQQGLYDESLDNLSLLLDNPNFSVKAKVLQAKIENQNRLPSAIPLIKQGEHYIVKGYINQNSDINLLIDTGASLSLLSQQRFDALAYEFTYIKTITLNTAGGIIEAKLYSVEQFSIDNYQVKDMLFAVSDTYQSDNDGLLGMNFLRKFTFAIDQSNQTLMLDYK